MRDPGATGRPAEGDDPLPRSRRRWVLVIPRERERRLYFLATLGLVAWYLLSRVL